MKYIRKILPALAGLLLGFYVGSSIGAAVDITMVCDRVIRSME